MCCECESSRYLQPNAAQKWTHKHFTANRKKTTWQRKGALVKTSSICLYAGAHVVLFQSYTHCHSTSYIVFSGKAEMNSCHIMIKDLVFIHNSWLINFSVCLIQVISLILLKMMIRSQMLQCLYIDPIANELCMAKQDCKMPFKSFSSSRMCFIHKGLGR